MDRLSCGPAPSHTVTSRVAVNIPDQVRLCHRVVDSDWPIVRTQHRAAAIMSSVDWTINASHLPLTSGVAIINKHYRLGGMEGFRGRFLSASQPNLARRA